MRTNTNLPEFSSNQIRCSKAKHTISFASSKQQGQVATAMIPRGLFMSSSFFT